jgi:hypothetical protein
MRLPSPNHVTTVAVLMTVALGVGVTLGTATPPSAQPAAQTPPPGQPAPPPPPKNLQFFPKNTTRPEIIQIMRQFSFALGVRCDHCHVDEEGPNGREDFASDEKTAKVKARAMLVMTKQINENLLSKVPDRSHPPVTVGCYTCHHGLVRPETLTGRLMAATTAGGGDSAVAELKKLRDSAEFGHFDVSEWGVTEAARTLAGAGKRKEALAVLSANAEFHPQSTAIPATMAEIHAANGDTAAAIAILQKILEKEPENRRAKQMLERLQGGKSGKP